LSNEFKNDNISVNVEKHPGSKIKLEIFVTPKASTAAYSKALKNVNKEISIPGFRKGKAPDALVTQNYSKYIDKEWQQIVMDTGFREALHLIQERPFKIEDAKCTALKEISRDNGTRFVIEFEAAPKVPTINLNDITLKSVERREITQQDIDHAVENLLLYYAEWTNITDRPVQEGDYIDLDIDKLDEPTQVVCKNTRFAVINGRMANWMRNMVIGKNLNESSEGDSEKESDSSADFKPIHCRITIKAIHHPILPELNDELAKKMGASDVEELKKRLIDDLNRRADEEVSEQLRHQVDEHLFQHYPFEVPASLIESDKKQRIADEIEQLTKRNTPKEVMARHAEEMEHSLNTELLRTYRLLFLIFKFAKEHNISVSQEEMMHELTNQIMQGENAPLIKGLQDPDEIRSRLNHHLLLRKCRDYIVVNRTQKQNA
jgi:trigger factor